MMSDWLNKLLAADDDGNGLGKLVPLIIIFVIWVISAISKAAQKRKKGAETETEPPEESEETSFDELAKKIRQRYAEAKEQAAKNREAQQGGKTPQQPPAKPVKPTTAPVTPRPATTAPSSRYETSAKQPMYEVTKLSEEATLRVVKSLEKPAVNVPVKVERPVLDKVEPAIKKIEGIHSDVPMVSTEAEILYMEHPYLAELAAQYATRDGFRKAILNYEILGPPLSLRD